MKFMDYSLLFAVERISEIKDKKNELALLNES